MAHGSSPLPVVVAGLEGGRRAVDLRGHVFAEAHRHHGQRGPFARQRYTRRP